MGGILIPGLDDKNLVLVYEKTLFSLYTRYYQALSVSLSVLPNLSHEKSRSYIPILYLYDF